MGAQLPVPKHVILKEDDALQLSVRIDGVKYSVEETNEAPYRAVTAWESISDLSRIENGSFNSQGVRLYDAPPLTHFQKRMRRDTDGVLSDHITKHLDPLDVERVKFIPEGGDWREIPNIETELEDGTTTQKLVYPYKNIHYKNDVHGRNRGVCPCMEKEEGLCDKQSHTQRNTLIPLFMAHSGSRNNDYAGCYGRVPKNGVFTTVTTDPCPSGKQGRVLHPDQNRLLVSENLLELKAFMITTGFVGSWQTSFGRWETRCHLLWQK